MVSISAGGQPDCLQNLNSPMGCCSNECVVDFGATKKQPYARVAGIPMLHEPCEDLPIPHEDVPLRWTNREAHMALLWILSQKFVYRDGKVSTTFSGPLTWSSPRKNILNCICWTIHSIPFMFYNVNTQFCLGVD